MAATVTLDTIEAVRFEAMSKMHDAAVEYWNNGKGHKTIHTMLNNLLDRGIIALPAPVDGAQIPEHTGPDTRKHTDFISPEYVTLPYKAVLPFTHFAEVDRHDSLSSLEPDNAVVSRHSACWGEDATITIGDIRALDQAVRNAVHFKPHDTTDVESLKRAVIALDADVTETIQDCFAGTVMISKAQLKHAATIASCRARSGEGA